MNDEKEQIHQIRTEQDWWLLTRKSNILLTANLILRKLQPEDAGPMTDLAGNISVSSMTARVPHPYSLEDAKAFISRCLAVEATGCTYAVTLAKSGVFIGCCGLGSGKGGTAPRLGYWLGEPYWGNGYGTEAAHALVDLAFKTTSHEFVNASCRVINPASRRVLEKCGFQKTDNGMIGSLATGAKVPVDYYVLDRNTWISLKSWSDSA